MKCRLGSRVCVQLFFCGFYHLKVSERQEINKVQLKNAFCFCVAKKKPHGISFLLTLATDYRMKKKQQVKNEKYFSRFTDMEKLFHFHFAFLYGNADT
jgi:hypothetical protein